MTKERNHPRQPGISFPVRLSLLQRPACYRQRQRPIRLGCRRQPVPRFLRRHRHISVGHCNEEVNRKLHAQIDKLQHVSTVFANEPQAALAKKIAPNHAGGKLTKSFFTNSGTEANETAILAARCYTGASEIVALRYSYHGRVVAGDDADGAGQSGDWAASPQPESSTPSTPTVTAAPSD